MSAFDLHQKVFTPVRNSDTGTAGPNTIFVFRQDGNKIIANYSGGTVQDGHLMGVFETNSSARLVYHCLTQTGTLKTGQALARFSNDTSGQTIIDMDWKWLSGDVGDGTSQYRELKDDT